MIISVLIFASFHIAKIPYALTLEISDEDEISSGVFLQAPVDALYWQDRLFVLDSKGYRVISTKQGTHKIIGKRGKGPGEFANEPVMFCVENHQLKVFEWNFHQVSYFDFEGAFISRSVPQVKGLYPNQIHLLSLNFEQRLELGFNFQFPSGCFFDSLEERTLQGEHLNRSILARSNSGEIIIGKQRGWIGLVASDCQITHQMPLGLQKFAGEPKPMASTYVTYEGKLTPMLENGLPLIGLAAASSEQVWALVRDERTETRWLYEINLIAKQVRYKAELDQSMDRIRYSQGMLILLSEEEAIVQAYQIKP